jgi:signal transduction histidine kinase/CHASE3 domain sensor protein
MLRRLGISQSVAAASAVLALVLVVEFVLVVLVISQLRTSANDARHSEEVIAGANDLEKKLLDLESGQRGFVITQKDSFLERARRARRTYPALVRHLDALLVDEPLQRQRMKEIAGRVAEYDRNWARPIVAIARRDPARAQRLVAEGSGKRRVDALQMRFSQFGSEQFRLSERHRDRSSRLGTIAESIGIGALVATIALLALYVRFVFGFVVAPIRRLGSAARRFAAGNLQARASPERAVELDELASEFNSMADALALRRAELESVLDSTSEGLLMADARGYIVFSNRAMDRMWESLNVPTSGPVYDRIIALAQLTGRAEEFGDAFARVAANPDLVYESEFEVPSLGRAFVGRTGPVHDANGNLLGRIFILREVTAERESERLKDEFVATVSHELRTPLTSIRGFVELLLAGEGGEVTADQRRFLSVVDRNSERLLRLVGDLLLIAQLDAHTLKLQLEELDLADIAVECVEAARPAADEAGLTLELLLGDAGSIRGDRARLAQLVDNLLSNACKFTPSGGRVEVTAGAENGFATLAVRDTGPGMSEQELSGLFERFYRTRRAMEQHVPGTGLGLAISQAIAEAHGGTITVASREGEGTTFTLQIPLAPASVDARDDADVQARL